MYLFGAGASRTPESSDKATITSGYSPCKAFPLLPFSFSAVTYKLLKLFIKTYLLTIHAHRNDGHITLAVSKTHEVLGDAQADQDRCLVLLLIACINSNVLALPNEDSTVNHCVIFKR